MTCSTCNGYEFVETPGQLEMHRCPTCAPRSTYRTARIARIRANEKPVKVTNVAPIYFVRCPVHLSKLGQDGEGKLLGRCDGCAREYAQALLWMRDNPVERKVVAA